MTEYREIEGWAGYRVGDDGTVWTRRRTREWRRLALTPGQSGYLRVHLSDNGRDRTRYVHQLVLEAFVGHRPEGYEVRHFPDSGRSNNRLENLSWGTRQANANDRIVHGTHPIGEKNGHSKLTVRQVKAIRAAAGTISNAELGRRYGVSRVAIGLIMNRKVWTHI